MILLFFLLASFLKILLIPTYRSTDFEVHRNWLAITHSLPLSKWYFENTSEWTLDYPPMFAYFEYFLSQIAKFVDPDMLRVDHLNYDSELTILFQRLTVIVTDVVFALGARKCIKNLQKENKPKRFLLAGLLLGNIGLLFVDHIHFQYNGVLFGILLFSIGYLLEGKHIKSAICFAILLNMKHIFIYIAPAFGVFLLKFYCLRSRTPIRNLLKLGLSVMAVTAISFGPFYDHIPQVLSRLFPFKRGLTHAYWAPNFWALYNFADKVLSIGLNVHKSSTTSSSGLVQEIEHQVLPAIRPTATFVLCAIGMLPCLLKLLLSAEKKMEANLLNFIKAIVLCACTSFMFGWHVHEKAILMVIIPMSLLATVNHKEAGSAFLISAVGHYSLFPLLFVPNLLIIKLSLFVGFTALSYRSFMLLYDNFKLSIFGKLYLFGFLALFFYENVIHSFLKIDQKLPFLPLMLTSVYCSLGVVYFWISFYYRFMISSNIEYSTKTASKKNK